MLDSRQQKYSLESLTFFWKALSVLQPFTYSNSRFLVIMKYLRSNQCVAIIWFSVSLIPNMTTVTGTIIIIIMASTISGSMLAFSTWLPSVFSVLRLPLPNLRLHLYEVNAVLIISNTFFLSILELFVHDFFQNLQKVNTLQVSHLPSLLYFVDFCSRQQVFSRLPFSWLPALVFSWLPNLTSNMLRRPCCQQNYRHSLALQSYS